MRRRAGAGASKGAGKTYVPGRTRLGPILSVIDPRVGREPHRDGALRESPKTVPSQSRGHDRSSPRTFWGAARRQGPGRSLSSSQRLDPDGWLRRFSTDLLRPESPAAWTPMHRERRTLTTLTARDLTDPGPVPIRVLDSGLLMGGTFTVYVYGTFTSR